MLPSRIPMAMAMAFFALFSTTLFAQVNLSCPAALTVKTSESGVGHCAAFASWMHPVELNCDRSALLELTVDENAPQIVRQGGNFKTSSLEVGVHQIKYVIAKGLRIKTCVTTVTVVDDEAPVIKNCPTEMSLSLTAGKYTMPDVLSKVSVTDNCEGFETIQYPDAGVYAGQDGDIIEGFVIASSYFHAQSATCQFSIRLTSPVLAVQDVATADLCDEECPDFLSPVLLPSTSASTESNPK